ncbi:MAG: magnesium transporter [Puia sp.]
MLTATAMGFFEGEISKAVVLALFIPLIISSGGNSGSQASSIIIRAMALGEINSGLVLRYAQGNFLRHSARLHTGSRRIFTDLSLAAISYI